MAPPPRITKGATARSFVNPIRNQREIRAPTPLHRKAVANNAASRPAKRLCPNKECSAPRIEDGVCHNCGTVVDDSNIVAEISFGEDSRGAAVVQGSYVAEGQGSARTLGSSFKRAQGAGEEREATLREGRQQMNGFVTTLQILDQAYQEGLQLFKLAATNNFIQGRRIDMVAAVCLYTACRQNSPCRVMLIDFADKLQVNVFKLGRTFKALHKAITIPGNGITPVFLEDLIWRFASKLEFGDDTEEVAKTAIKLAQRMSFDWMAMGRRPSGVCGACLILAARMHNYRRTVTEVVYIVKVTTATIQKRFSEFKLTATSALTVEEFLNNELLSFAHDPPSFYEKQEEFIKNKKTRKRKRRGQLLEEDEDRDHQEGDETDANKRQKTTTPGPDAALPTVELRRDADGFAIPPQPPRPQPDFDDIVDETMENTTDEALQKLARFVGEEASVCTSDDEEDSASSTGSTTSTTKRDGRRGRNQEIHVPEEWSRDEQELESQMIEIISDPKSAQLVSDPNHDYHAILYAFAEKRAEKHMHDFKKANPPKKISMEEEILDDEFANDPEVQNCLLSAEDIARKEKVWVNENKNWLRKQQVKAYQKRMAANGPPKRTRNRKKGIRVGELQTSPASSAGEAAVAVIKTRALSRKINYANIENLFDEMDAPGGGALGSEATSRVTSRAGSSVPESPSASESITNDADSEIGDNTAIRDKSVDTARRRGTIIATTAEPAPSIAESDLSDDYVQEEEQEEQEDWRRNRNIGVEGGDRDEDEREVSDQEDIGDGRLEDMDSGLDDDDRGMDDEDGW